MSESLFKKGHALIIGIGGNLPNTIQDAQGLASILMDTGRCAYPKNQVTLLTGEKSHRKGILSALEALSKATDSNSTVTVYFSGHGYYVKTGQNAGYYLMPHGYNVNDLPETAVSGAEFAGYLQAIKAKKLLVLLDCCYAGGLDNIKAPGLEFANVAAPPEAISALAAGSGRYLLASSRDDELSYAGNPYSAFTLGLIEALCGMNLSKKDGFVRVIDLITHTFYSVVDRTQKRQHPVFNFENASNFNIAYYAGGAKQTKGLPFEETPVIESDPGDFRRLQNQQGGFIQNNWNVLGGVVNVQGDYYHYEGVAPRQPGDAGQALLSLFQRVQRLPKENRVKLNEVVEQVRHRMQQLQGGDDSQTVLKALEISLQELLEKGDSIGDEFLSALAAERDHPAMSQVASKVLAARV